MAKNITIIILVALLIGMSIFTFTRGDSKAQIALDQISAEREELIRTNGILEAANRSSRERVAELEDQIQLSSRKIKDILTALADGNKQTEHELDEYGRINNDFTEFLDEYGAKE